MYFLYLRVFIVYGELLIYFSNGNLGKTLLSTSILQKALELPANGFFVYNLNGANYNGNDLPVGVYSYGSACIYKRNSESIFVFLTGIAASSTPLATNWYDGASWTGWKTYVTNTDLSSRFNPIEISGTRGDTFKSILKDKCNNSVNFIVFNGSTEKPISDNPFTSKNGYCIVFNSDRLNAYNFFILLGITQGIIEVKSFDARS